jgi:SPP1 gp7 family putative phage head morphogenesis protein
MADVKAFAVQPVEAIDFLRRKVAIPTRAWTDLWEAMHARAFVVAGANTDALVADFHEAVRRAIEEGRTLDQFREDFDRIVAEHGWSYRGTRGWRSRVIFETNLRMAYAAGRWAQIQRVKRHRPYLRYVTMDDERVRPLHREWHNVVLPVEHPWWATHFPPNGWGCRCFAQSLSARDVDRFGLNVWGDAPLSPLVGRTVKTPDGPVTVMVPRGIDPGFAYNVGEAGFGRGPQSLALERHGDWTALEAPGLAPQPLDPLPLDVAPAAPLGEIAGEAALRQALTEILGGEEVVVADPAGRRVRLGQAITDWLLSDPSRLDGRERYLPLLTATIEDPAEIWAGFAKSGASGRTILRRRYVKLFDLGDGRSIGLLIDADEGEVAGWTAFAAGLAAAGLRTGLLVWRR